MLLEPEFPCPAEASPAGAQGVLPFFDPPALQWENAAAPALAERVAPIVEAHEPRPKIVSVPGTLDDVLRALERNPSRDRRHTEMKSAIRRMGIVLRRNLCDVSAEPEKLRALIAAAPPATVRMTKERWSRVRSLTLAALRDLGLDMMPGRDVGGVSPAWRVLRERLPTRAQQHGLTRFMSFCTRNDVEPDDVTKATFEAFGEALKTRSLKDKPDAIFRGSVRYWDRAVEGVPGWPKRSIGLERHARYYSLDWESFPPSFVVDVEAFLESTGSTCELDDDYQKAVAPSTVELRRRQLRQMASMVVLSGRPIEQIETLASLVEPSMADAALRYQYNRDGKSTTSLEQKAWLLCVIARHWVKDTKRAEEIGKVANNIAEKLNKTGMTERNRTRLRQFDHPDNVHAFVDLPRKVFRRAAREKLGTVDEARRVMWALAMELELRLPMRVGNLTGLEINKHFLMLSRGRARDRHLLIPAAETKNGKALETILSEDTMSLHDSYLTTYRPRLCASPSPFLFPAADGARRNTISFSKGLSTFVERETGMRIHVHLFRHFTGTMSIKANPNDWETPRQLLGHKSPETTRRFYVEQSSAQGIARWDATLDALRDEAARVAARRRLPTKKGGDDESL